MGQHVSTPTGVVKLTSQFNLPLTITHGGGARREVVDQARYFGVKRVLLVTDEGMVQLGVSKEITHLLSKGGIDVVVFDQVQPDPTDENVLDGLALLKERKCEAIVALGGGSSIDTAKVISILTANPQPMRQYMGYHKIPSPGLPLLAIPTTAGTGSEVTKAAVITDTANDVKMMMFSAHLVPTVALVDFELTMTMPKALTAAVGVDTLTHAIEAYVSKKANGMTDPLALSCIDLVARHLREAWGEPNNREAREGMMLAACQGGMAFSNSSVCLVHGMSRPVGAVFHVPHGLSNAVLLPTVTRYSITADERRYATVARTLGCAKNNQSDEIASSALVDALEQLNVDLEIPRLRDCRGTNEAIFRDSVQKMARDALASGSPQNNPRIPREKEIVALYDQAW